MDSLKTLNISKVGPEILFMPIHNVLYTIQD